MNIKLRYSSIDGVRKTFRFQSLAGARAKALSLLGPNADLGSYYAVSPDGVGKVEVTGCALAELFSDPKAPAKPDYFTVSCDDGNYPHSGPAYAYEAQAQASLNQSSDEEIASYRLRIARWSYDNDFLGWVPRRYAAPPNPFAVYRIAPAYCWITDGLIGSNATLVSNFLTEAEAQQELDKIYEGERDDEESYELREWHQPNETTPGYYRRKVSPPIPLAAEAFGEIPF